MQRSFGRLQQRLPRDGVAAVLAAFGDPQIQPAADHDDGHDVEQRPDDLQRQPAVIAEVQGTQSSSDPKWNNSSITYWGITEMKGAQGVQRGYFLNDHGAAGQDRGSFEGRVSIADGEVVVEGTWQYTGGQGEFAGITGGGTFKTRLASPTTVEAKWQGAYELAGAAAA